MRPLTQAKGLPDRIVRRTLVLLATFAGAVDDKSLGIHDRQAGRTAIWHADCQEYD